LNAKGPAPAIQIPAETKAKHAMLSTLAVAYTFAQQDFAMILFQLYVFQINSMTADIADKNNVLQTAQHTGPVLEEANAKTPTSEDKTARP
jgi:hypothetical protein